MRNLSVTLLVAIFLTVFISPDTAWAARVHGVLRVVKGKVKVKSGKNGKTKRARIGQKVYPKDTIITGKDSRVKIVMVDKNEINISPDSKMMIEKYEFNGKNKKAPKNVLLNVLYGKVRNKVKQRYNGKKSKFQIKTPSAVAGVRGTDFFTSYKPATQQTQVVTFKGQVAFGLPGANGSIQNPVQIRVGQTASSASGAPPTPAVSVPKNQLAAMDKDSATTPADQTESDRKPANGNKKKEKREEKKEDKQAKKEDRKDKKEAKREKREAKKDNRGSKKEARQAKRDAKQGKREPGGDDKQGARKDENKADKQARNPKRGGPDNGGPGAEGDDGATGNSRKNARNGGPENKRGPASVGGPNDRGDGPGPGPGGDDGPVGPAEPKNAEGRPGPIGDGPALAGDGPGPDGGGPLGGPADGGGGPMMGDTMGPGEADLPGGCTDCAGDPMFDPVAGGPNAPPPPPVIEVDTNLPPPPLPDFSDCQTCTDVITGGQGKLNINVTNQ